MLKPELVDKLDPIEVVGTPQARDRVCVFTIHDGAEVPRDVLGDDAEAIAAHPEIAATYLRERDWGANRVAAALAAELGLPGHLRLRLARALLDFGRFRGVSDDTEPYETRKAIYPPAADLLSRKTRHRLITEHYDRISHRFSPHFATAQITLAVHTYDGVTRPAGSDPEVRLVRRALSYPCQGQASAVFFDRLFPQVLCNATCNKSLMLQTVLNGLNGNVAPYVMPQGSVESRIQVWRFFRFLHTRFASAHPETAAHPAFERIWEMLLDVNRRSCESELLRGYLHNYGEAPAGQEALYADAERAYDDVAAFLGRHEAELVDGYRFSSERPSCIGLEVRKDLLYDIDLEAGIARPRDDAEDVARELARQVAAAVRDHLGAFFPTPDPPATGTSSLAEPVAVI